MAFVPLIHSDSINIPQSPKITKNHKKITILTTRSPLGAPPLGHNHPLVKCTGEMPVIFSTFMQISINFSIFIQISIIFSIFIQISVIFSIFIQIIPTP